MGAGAALRRRRDRPRQRERTPVRAPPLRRPIDLRTVPCGTSTSTSWWTHRAGERGVVMGTEASLAPVVVCVGRATSGAAVEFGAAEAVCTGRPLELVHVAPPGDGWLATIGRDALRVAASRADGHL